MKTKIPVNLALSTSRRKVECIILIPSYFAAFSVLSLQLLLLMRQNINDPGRKSDVNQCSFCFILKILSPFFLTSCLWANSRYRNTGCSRGDFYCKKFHSELIDQDPFPKPRKVWVGEVCILEYASLHLFLFLSVSFCW